MMSLTPVRNVHVIQDSKLENLLKSNQILKIPKPITIKKSPSFKENSSSFKSAFFEDKKKDEDLKSNKVNLGFWHEDIELEFLSPTITS